MKKSTLLRQLLAKQDIVVCPGVSDGLSARLVEKAGFSAVYASGGAIARSNGIPDIGLLTMTEIVARLESIIEVTQLPVVADADTGYGNEINVRRMVQNYARIGVAALHIEDQEFPKRCGHLDDKKLVSADEMVIKIQVAKKTAEIVDPDLVIIARTDAIAVEGFEAALHRANLYAKAGADMIFVEAPQTMQQIEQIAQQITAPKLMNMFHGGKTPLVPASTLASLGYKLVIIPSDLQRAAIKAMEKTLAVLKRDGDTHAIASELTTFQERELLVDTKKYFE